MSEPDVLRIEQANERLPYIRAIVRDVMAVAGDLAWRQERLDEMRRLYEDVPGESPHAEELEEMERDVERDSARFRELESELEQIGVHLVDSSTGLVEVLSEPDGRPIRISWKPDEPEFLYWREIDDDIGTRKPLLESVAGRTPTSLDNSSFDHSSFDRGTDT